MITLIDASVRRLAEIASEWSRKEDQANKLDADLTRAEIDQRNRNYVAVAGMNAGVTIIRFED